MSWRASFVGCVGIGLSAWAGIGAGEDSRVRVPLPGALQHVNPADVRVGGELGRRIGLTVRRNVFALNYDRDFLAPFQQRVKYPATKEEWSRFYKERKRFIGTGETVDALVYLAAYTRDPEVTALKERLIGALLATQDANGYIGQFVWEPNRNPLYSDFAWEDASFIALALAGDYRFFGPEASLQGARALVECLLEAYRKDPSRVAGFSAISCCDAMLTLYQLTGESKFLEGAKNIKLGPARTTNVAALSNWDDVLFQRGWHDERKKNKTRTGVIPKDLPGRLICHVYRYLERMYVQLKLHRLEPGDNYTRMSRKYYAALVRPEKPGMTVVGGIGRHEGWSEDQCGADGHSETCAAAYSLLFFEELANLDGRLCYGEAMERVLYNALFGAQDPQGRRLRYFTPSFGPRLYFEPDIYCCPGNFRRAVSRLPLSVYYRFRNGVAVNLYAASEVEFDLGNELTVKMRQATNYPTCGRVTVTVSPSRPAEFPVFLRVPRWCPRPEVTVCGAAVPAAAGTVVVARTWNPGDTIELTLPMAWRLVRGRALQAGRVAVMRGPLVFCLSRARNKLPADMPLRDIVLDPRSLGEPVADSHLRPQGLACPVAAWSPAADRSAPPDLQLILDEFPEPTGEAVYFRIPDMEAAVEDELVESVSR